MKKIVTSAIVLSRINFGEADKIVTFITPSSGKLSCIARGARKIKSKLAGGIELFSVNIISYIEGKGDIKTLVSSKMETSYHAIIADYHRTEVAYKVLQAVNKVTHEDCGPEFYELLSQTLNGLADNHSPIELVWEWFMMRLVDCMGHRPLLDTTNNGEKLLPNAHYDFDYATMSFVASEQGSYARNDIKFLRLLLETDIQHLLRIHNIDVVVQRAKPLISAVFQQFVPQN